MNILTRVKVITSYTGHAQFLFETEPGILGVIPSQSTIPSPYAYSPTWSVYLWRGTPVVVVETRHKRYEIFRVDGPILPADVDA